MPSAKTDASIKLLEKMLEAQGMPLSSLTQLDTSSQSNDKKWRDDADERRVNVYTAVALVSGSKRFLRMLVTVDGTGEVFKLEATTPTSVPLQQMHIGPGAIPSEMADRACRDDSIDTLFSKLRSVLGSFPWSLRKSVKTFLEDFSDEGCDFGQLYGYLRPWCRNAPSHFSEVVALMRERKQSDIKLRSEAMNGDRIVDSKIPPRRVWDLYSNRVLPFYAIASDDPSFIPPNVWAVSHSWVADGELAKVATPINNFEWPVPIPKAASIENIRIELLNLGAEYVFLDVLCLRQGGVAEDDYQRKREWKLDVPTIGHIYQHTPRQTTITYFNGLGLPYRVSQSVLQSDRHWLRRVWTLQETTEGWIPGGVTETVFDDPAQRVSGGHKFIEVLDQLLEITAQRPYADLFKVLEIVRERVSTKDVDAVTSLAYLLHCETLSNYEETLGVEDAWDFLLRCMPDRIRTDILMSWPRAGKGKYSWRPTWKQLKTAGNLPTSWPVVRYADAELLQYSHQGCLNGLDVYHHTAYVIEQCRIWFNKSSKGPCHIEIPLEDDSLEVEASHCSMSSRRGGDSDVYDMVGVAELAYWVVGRIVGERRVGGHKCREFQKVFTLEIADRKQRKKIRDADPGQSNVKVAYCPARTPCSDDQD